VLKRDAPDSVWVFQPADWHWESGALQGLLRLTGAGLLVSVTTNQSGVGRGLFDAAAVDAVHARMLSEAREAGARIDAVFVCPHAPQDHCRCRKPAPGLVEAAIAAAGIPPAKTVMVGDAQRDLEAAHAAGVRAVLVRTGKGRATEALLDDARTPVYDNLLCVAEALVRNNG